MVAGMKQNPNKILSIWLFVLCGFIILMTTFGGFVRVTRSGLSMVEWHVVTGIIPPLGEAAWQATFEKYQQTPEYQKINSGMSLTAYKAIYYREYIHRLLGRLTGLMYVLPLAFFLIVGLIPLRKSLIYLLIGLLFALQGLMGWYMVKSGLVNQPHVSHYRLTAHLLLALTLLTLCFWVGLNRAIGFVKPKSLADRTLLIKLALTLQLVTLMQIGYGGFVSGLKAGYVSTTFPLMFGYLIPPGLMSTLQPWPQNLVANMVTVHFVHRWLAFGVLLLSLILYYKIRQARCLQAIQRSVINLLLLLGFQIGLGLTLIWWYIPPLIALIHQTVAFIVFMVILFINHRFFGAPNIYSSN